MFIDYLALLLVNMVAAHFILAGYVYRGFDDPDQKRWALGFGMNGAVALIFGAVMCFTWPLPGPFNSAFGEPSVLLGTILLTASVGMARGWNLTIVAVYAFFAGLAAIDLGGTIIVRKMTQQPLLSGAGFILSGLAGVFAAPTLVYFRKNQAFRTLAALVLVVTGLIWASSAYPAIFMHMKAFGKWMPTTMHALPIGK
jgi:putative membrane protein